MFHLVQRYDSGSRRDGHRVGMYRCLDRMYQLAADDPRLFLPPAASAELWRLCNEFCVHYDALTRLAAERGCLLYCPAYKIHMVLHICWFARYQAPRATWSYVYEDFVRTVKTMAISNMRGTQLHKIASKVVAQWLLAFSVRLHLHYG